MEIGNNEISRHGDVIEIAGMYLDGAVDIEGTGEARLIAAELIRLADEIENGD